MSASDIILKLSNIESYYGPIMAIRGISLEVPRGKIVTLLGANGAGKTTVLKTISGILDPQKGSIEFLGKPIQRMEADKIVRLEHSEVKDGRAFIQGRLKKGEHRKQAPNVDVIELAGEPHYTCRCSPNLWPT